MSIGNGEKRSAFRPDFLRFEPWGQSGRTIKLVPLVPCQAKSRRFYCLNGKCWFVMRGNDQPAEPSEIFYAVHRAP